MSIENWNKIGKSTNKNFNHRNGVLPFHSLLQREHWSLTSTCSASTAIVVLAWIGSEVEDFEMNYCAGGFAEGLQEAKRSWHSLPASHNDHAPWKLSKSMALRLRPRIQSSCVEQKRARVTSCPLGVCSHPQQEPSLHNVQLNKTRSRRPVPLQIASKIREAFQSPWAVTFGAIVHGRVRDAMLKVLLTFERTLGSTGQPIE